MDDLLMELTFMPARMAKRAMQRPVIVHPITPKKPKVITEAGFEQIAAAKERRARRARRK